LPSWQFEVAWRQAPNTYLLAKCRALLAPDPPTDVILGGIRGAAARPEVVLERGAAAADARREEVRSVAAPHTVVTGGLRCG
jgi:hypothetical protein